MMAKTNKKGRVEGKRRKEEDKMGPRKGLGRGRRMIRRHDDEN